MADLGAVESSTDADTDDTLIIDSDYEMEEEEDTDSNLAEDEMLIVVTLLDERLSFLPKVRRTEFRVSHDDLSTKESSRELFSKIVSHLCKQYPSNLKARNGIIDLMVNYFSELSGRQDCVFFYVVTLYTLVYHVGSTEERKFKTDEVILQAYSFEYSDEGQHLRSITDVNNEESEPPVYSSVYNFVHDVLLDDGKLDFSRANPEAELAYFIKPDF